MNLLAAVTAFNLVLALLLLVLFWRARQNLAQIHCRDGSNDGSALRRHYLEKAENYRKAGKDCLALLTVKQAFQQQPGDRDIFELYFDCLLNRAEELQDRDSLVRRLEDAEDALLSHAEKAQINDVGLFEEYQKQIEELSLKMQAVHCKEGKFQA
ncbi:MAG: hypothetical protein UMV23_06780 [Halanaerobium sp.]|nr:hypothetical protein [Halanaerobium sp.]